MAPFKLNIAPARNIEVLNWPGLRGWGSGEWGDRQLDFLGRPLLYIRESVVDLIGPSIGLCFDRGLPLLSIAVKRIPW